MAIYKHDLNRIKSLTKFINELKKCIYMIHKTYAIPGATMAMYRSLQKQLKSGFVVTHRDGDMVSSVYGFCDSILELNALLGDDPLENVPSPPLVDSREPCSLELAERAMEPWRGPDGNRFVHRLDARFVSDTRDIHVADLAIFKTYVENADPTYDISAIVWNRSTV